MAPTGGAIRRMAAEMETESYPRREGDAEQALLFPEFLTWTAPPAPNRVSQQASVRVVLSRRAGPLAEE